MILHTFARWRNHNEHQRCEMFFFTKKKSSAENNNFLEEKKSVHRDRDHFVGSL